MLNPCGCGNPMEGAKIYKKTATVRAKQMDRSFAVQTSFGLQRAEAGDYLCQGVDGEMWPVKKEIFEKTYEIVPEGV